MVGTEYDTLGFTDFNIETLIEKLNAGLYVYYNGLENKPRSGGESIQKRKFNYYYRGDVVYNSRKSNLMAYYSIPDVFFEILDIFPVTEPSASKGGKKSIKRNNIRGITSKLRRRSSVRRKKTTRRKHN
jgi:hypothetical protein